MQDHYLPMRFNMTKVAAFLFGCVGQGIIVFDMFWLEDSDDWGHLGLSFVALAVVLRIRSYFVEMEDRLRNAFEIGRAHERSLQRVR